MKNALGFALGLLLFSFVGPQSAAAFDIDRPMQFDRKFSGDQKLRFTSGGRAFSQKGTRMSYRIIRSSADWKKIWGYLYDDTVKVDFRKHSVVAVYRSPAAGKFEIRPTYVRLTDDHLTLKTEVGWTGSDARSHPFLFLVVPHFRQLSVEEKFRVPSGKEPRYP